MFNLKKIIDLKPFSLNKIEKNIVFFRRFE